MSGEEIKETKLFDLVKSLYIIDAKLNGETRELVCEYNEIIEEIWNILGGVESKIPLSKKLIRNNGGKK
jgi:hypothetical protein